MVKQDWFWNAHFLKYKIITWLDLYCNCAFYFGFNEIVTYPKIVQIWYWHKYYLDLNLQLSVDADGFLKITDRKKQMFKTSHQIPSVYKSQEG